MSGDDSKETEFVGKLLLLLLVLLPLILLGFGYYLLTLPPDEYLVGVKGSTWFGIGQSIIASGLVSLVMFLGLWAERKFTSIGDQDIRTLLRASLAQSEQLKQAGVRRIHDDRYIRGVYQQHQATVTNHLDLLGMSLTHFREDVGDHLKEWVESRRNLHIRLLVLDPRSPFCFARDREEGLTSGYTSDGALRLTRIVLELDHPRIQIRWYDTLPSVNFFRLDNVVFIGHYLIGRLSRQTTTLELESHGDLARQYLKHFEDLWDPPKGQTWSFAPSVEDLVATQQQTALERVRLLSAATSAPEHITPPPREIVNEQR